ncbi:acyltransferase family protein [Iodobacter ciconiae]|uniref:Acyltransferase n=1 Tax=Iodobacter ciconiae TaxID=2496266 RepID=A0A3S8ZWL0_9NEIS|nr:acyltransferase [Iodobacter ciconiae]AZN37815.1 acyltransferase [Iodobacter ciconiae]
MPPHSSNIEFNPRLEHIRALAALLVFFFHAFHHFYGNWKSFPEQPLFAIITEGHLGVGLFFTLSGFLFMKIAMTGNINYRRFIFNRFLRIFPLFLLVFFLAISLGRDKFQAQDLLYLLISNIGKPATSDYFVTGAAWTISIEFTFYLIFPFLALFVRQQGLAYIGRLLLIFLVLKLCVLSLAGHPAHVLQSTQIGRLDQFLIGMGFATLGSSLFFKKPYALIISLATILAISIFRSQYALLFNENSRSMILIIWYTLEALLWGFFIYAYINIQWRPAHMIEEFFSFIGQRSYSFYLLHAMVLYLINYYIPISLSLPILLIKISIAFILSCLLADLSWRSIELPFLNLRQHYVH